jgi:hypothetical protein
MTIAYTTGQITLTNGSAVVTGIGTAWQISLIAGGLIAAEADGNPLPIESVNSDTSITAAIEWKGATGTYGYALVRDTAYLQQLNLNSATLARLIAELEAGTIFKYDASGDLSGRSAYDDRAKDFSYLVVIGVTTPELYVKASAASGAWAGPFSYGTGPKGDTGPTGPAGIANPRGTYASGTAYLKNDVVLYNGSSFVALQATTGNPPATLPTTANAYWQLTAIKGTDGNGTGDLVGPNGVTDGNVAVFDGVTGKLLKQQTKAQFKTWLATTALDVSFSNGVANLPGNPTTAQAAIEAIGNSGGKNDALLALEIADLKGQRMGMVGGVADSFDDTTGVVTQGIGGIDGYTQVMLHLDGADLSTSFPDVSFTGRTWTRTGSQISTTKSKFGGSSLYVGPANSGGCIQSSSFADLAFGTGDFTIDMWFNADAITTSHFFVDMRSADNQAAVCLYIAGGKASLYVSGANIITGATTLATNTWYHLALVRSSGTTRLYLNGVLDGSVSDATNYVAGNVVIGNQYAKTSANSLPGYIDEFRITKGVARWTAAFTPSTMPYNVPGGIDANSIAVLHLDGADASTAITDSSPYARTWLSQNAALSTAQSKFGGASLNIAGVSNRFVYSNALAPSIGAIGTGDFTFEAWIRPTSTSSTIVIETRSSSTLNNPTLYMNASGQATYLIGAAARITGTTALALNTWHHIAVARSGGISRLFVNGVQEGSNYADTTNIVTPSTGPYVGCDYTGASNFSGFIDELRISNVARYTTNFTPYNVAFFVEQSGSFNFVYDATNDWFSPSLVVGTQTFATTLTTETEITTLRRYRVKLSAGALSDSGASFRLLVSGLNTAPGKPITNMYLGEAASTGNPWDMIPGTLAKVTFNGGQGGVTPNTTAPQWSDWIAYSVDKAKNYIVAFDMAASTGQTRYTGTQPANTSAWYKDGGAEEAGTPAVTGYASFSIFPSFYQVQVRAGIVDYNNMTLVSVNYAAQSTPSTARVAVQLADSLTLVPNTDFMMEVTRDGGNTWTAVTLALSMPSFGGVKMYEGTASLSGQPTGTAMSWRFKTLTNKNIIASGVVLQQS